MLLHACLLLFIITTDNTLALSHHRCGGNVSLDEEPAGHINLTLPGLSGDNPSNKQSDKTPLVSVCTWMIDIPRGRMALLKLEWLEIGSRISVQCFGNEENRVLEIGGAVVLSGCDRDKASISWTGAGRSSSTIQLSYSVHEDRRNSSLDQSTPHSSQDLRHGSQTGTIVTEKALIGHEVLKGRERGRGYFSEVLKEWTSMPPSVSSPSSEIQGLLHASSPLQGLSMAVRADRETNPLPEEEPNNQPETSGAAHLTDGPVSAKGRTHHYFQHTFTTDSSFHTSHSTNTENTSGEPNQTQMALKHKTASSSDIMLDTDSQKLTVTQTSKLSISSQAYPSVPSSRVPKVTSSLPEQSSRTTWDSSTMVSAQSGSPGEKLPPRSQRSTGMVNLDIMSIVTSDPLNSQTEQQQGNSSGPYTTNVSSSSSPGPSRSHSSTTYITELDTDISTMEATSFHPNISQSDSIVSTASDRTNQTSVFESFDESQSTERRHTFPSSPQTQTNFPERIENATHSPLPHTTSLSTQTGKEEAQTATQRYFPNASMAKNTIPSSPDFTMVDDRTFPGSSTGRSAQTSGDEVHNSATTGSSAGTQTYSQHHTRTLFHDYSPTNSPRPPPHVSSSSSIHSSISSYRPQTRTAFSASSQLTPTSLSSPSTTTETPVHRSDVKAMPTATIEPASLHTPLTQPHLPLPSTTAEPAIDGKSHTDGTNTQTSLLHLTTAKSDQSPGQVDTEKEEKDDKYFQWLYSSTPTQPPTTGLPPQKPPPGTIPHPSQKNHTTLTSVLTSTPMWSTATSQTPKFYIVPDEPTAIKVESINLLLQIIVEESGSAFTVGLEEDTAAWVEPYLQRAPGFSKLLGAWSSGHAVQSLVEFKTSVALQWLGMTGPKSLLEQTGLAQAVRDGRKFRLSKVINVTLGGLQGDVCDWLLQCEAGYRCVFQPGTSNYACSSMCHFDYCHHHGICTHHPSQLPVCRCLVGEDFWYMGQRCDMRMTQPRLVGTCLAILLIIVTVIGVLAFVAVRRYRAILIQAKVDQTRSSYRRFNHFDELSGRFWLRSWAGSADSLENSAYIRSNELLHLRTLDRPCCYHDDTLSLASTCPSHGARINTVYLHSSQYGWRGSEMSMGEGVLDSGKASDLSVCSWPVEPIHWTPFPLLQQLASHRTPTVRISRPRSYCEGMELVDLGKSWTA